jgi:hypothetical protein
MNRDGGIRTHDPLLPKQVRYQTAPRPVTSEHRDRTAAGENMPPKSTLFFPKPLTGLLFNSLS